MNRNEFLKKLKEALTLSVDEKIIEEQVKYYDNYISDEEKKGRSEKEIIEELGDPRLIAKTISTVNKVGDTSGKEDSPNNNHYHNNEYGDSRNYDDSKEKSRGQYRTYSNSTGILGCTIAAIVFFVIIMSILRFFGYAVYGLSSLAFSGPIGFILVIALIYILFGRGGRR